MSNKQYFINKGKLSKGEVTNEFIQYIRNEAYKDYVKYRSSCEYIEEQATKYNIFSRELDENIRSKKIVLSKKTGRIFVADINKITVENYLILENTYEKIILDFMEEEIITTNKRITKLKSMEITKYRMERYIKKLSLAFKKSQLVYKKGTVFNKEDLQFAISSLIGKGKKENWKYNNKFTSNDYKELPYNLNSLNVNKVIFLTNGKLDYTIQTTADKKYIIM